MVKTHEFKKVPIHSNTTIVIRSKLPCQGGTSLVNNSREQSIAPKAKPRTAWRVLCQVRVRIVYAHTNFIHLDYECHLSVAHKTGMSNAGPRPIDPQFVMDASAL